MMRLVLALCASVQLATPAQAQQEEERSSQFTYAIDDRNLEREPPERDEVVCIVQTPYGVRPVTLDEFEDTYAESLVDIADSCGAFNDPEFVRRLEILTTLVDDRNA